MTLGLLRLTEIFMGRQRQKWLTWPVLRNFWAGEMGRKPILLTPWHRAKYSTGSLQAATFGADTDLSMIFSKLH